MKRAVEKRSFIIDDKLQVYFTRKNFWIRHRRRFRGMSSYPTSRGLYTSSGRLLRDIVNSIGEGGKL